MFRCSTCPARRWDWRPGRAGGAGAAVLGPAAPASEPFSNPAGPVSSGLRDEPQKAAVLETKPGHLFLREDLPAALPARLEQRVKRADQSGRDLLFADL